MHYMIVGLEEFVGRASQQTGLAQAERGNHMNPRRRVARKTLRRINSEADQQAGPEHLEISVGSLTDTEQMSAIDRSAIYDMVRKRPKGSLQERPRPELN